MSIEYRMSDQHDADVAQLGKKLDEFNSAHVAPSQKTHLSVIVRDDDGELIAGLSGETASGWLFVRWLWVDKTHSGQGIADTLLEKAEVEARTRGCIGAHIDTFNPRALCVYKRQGYQVFGEIIGYISGQTRTYLQKRWG